MRISPRTGARRAAAALAAVVAFALPACGPNVPTGTDPLQGQPTRTTSAPPTVPGSAGSCDPGSPRSQIERGIQVEGVTSTGQPVWALFATESIQPDTPVTVWWRVAGNGALKITLVGPEERVVPVGGARPGQLPGWEQPGEPWVSELVFPEAGCWRLYFARGSRDGDLWVQVP